MGHHGHGRDAELLDFTHVGQVRDVPAADPHIRVGLARGRFRHGVKPAVVEREDGCAPLLRREQRREQPARHLRDVGESTEGAGWQRRDGERGDDAGDAASAVGEHDAEERAGVVGGDVGKREARSVGPGQVRAMASPLIHRRGRAGGDDGEGRTRAFLHRPALRLRGDGGSDGRRRVVARGVGVGAEEGEQFGIADLRGIGEVAAGEVRGNLRAMVAEILELSAQVGVLTGDDGGVVREFLAEGIDGLQALPVGVNRQSGLQGRGEIGARVAAMNQPLPAVVAAQHDERAAEPGHLDLGLGGRVVRDVERRGAVESGLHFELVGARIVGRAMREEDVILPAGLPARRARGQAARRAHHDAGERILATGRAGLRAITGEGFGGDNEVAGDVFEGQLADVVVIPTRSVGDHHKPAGARGVDVEGLKFVGARAPALDLENALEIRERRRVVELVGERGEIVGKRRGIVVHDGKHGGRGRAERRAAGGRAEREGYRFRALDGGVIRDRDGEGFGRRVAVGPVQRTARARVIAACRSGAVGCREADAHRTVCAPRAGDGDRGGAGILGDGIGRRAELQRARRAGGGR